MDDKSETIRDYRTHQEKYVYYVIALCVAGIGFAIQKTTGVALKRTQIPLGIAVVSWGASIFCGLRFIRYVLSNLYANIALFDIAKGEDEEVGRHPLMIDAAIKGVLKAVEKNSGTASKSFKWQYRLFFLGIIFFVTWQLWEMYELSLKVSI